ncbi:MAG: hypothetical protein HC810_07560 [Acaryochloridaceae cyanobacterium RL_2_7]|nr:hypothetical protein [Acaryochloridaceae cyanobacterium RL_2_7]
MIGLIQKLLRLKQQKVRPVNLELQDIQGLIISSYGHLSHTTISLFEIKEPTKVQGWLEHCIEQGRMTSALRDQPKVAITSAMNIAFTAAGMRALGASETLMESFSHEFQQGMQHVERSRRIGDYQTINDPQHWDDYWHRPIHLMLILQGNPEELESTKNLIIQEGEASGLSFINHEQGYIPESHQEHFGFTDSISQPTIEGSPQAYKNKRFDSQITKAGEFILGYINEDGNYPQTPCSYLGRQDQPV